MLNSQENKEKNTRSGKSRGQKEKWNERVVQINRVTKVCKGGKKLSFRAVVIIGNENGQVGVGVGKADDVINSITKAITDARRNLITVPITKTQTIPHLTIGNFGACSILIKPAAQGTGVIAGSSTKTVLELAGIKNILSKQLGAGNILNNARATIFALENLKTPAKVAFERDLPIEKFYS
jgi:small subunit ribosomal protein S5|tara:strand:- start:9872 stop:10414 length:543 start_codon:yes stop_codon:yes gene_type:complete